MPYARREDLSLFYEQEGSAEPPLLFVHGWCCDHTFFRPQFDHFKSSHTVTALDLRGCGNSDRPTDGYDLPTLADDVAWLCDELGISRPIVVGHSLGGMIAIELAARHSSGPLAVVAVDPGPINPLPETQRVYKGSRRSSKAPIWNGIAALAMCKVPLLVLRSRTGGSNEPARLLPLKPDLHVGVTVGAGHFHQLEVPEQVTPMMERFILVAITESRGRRQSRHRRRITPHSTYTSGR